jgi:hypothetical protein
VGVVAHLRDTIPCAASRNASKNWRRSDGKRGKIFGVSVSVPKTFCTSFLSVRQFVEEQYGQGSFKKLRDALKSRDGVELPPVIAPGSWLPTAWFVRSLELGTEIFGPPDFSERFGRKAAEYELKWVHRLVLRFTSPIWLLERGRDVWERSHDTGRWEIESEGQWMRGRLYDFAGSSIAYCASLRTWLTRACQMTGAQTILINEPECRAKGAKACVFEGSW